MLNTDFCKWCVVYKIDGKTQDDKKDKLGLSAMFRYPAQAEDYIKTLPKETRDRFYIVNSDDYNNTALFDKYELAPYGRVLFIK